MLNKAQQTHLVQSQEIFNDERIRKRNLKQAQEKEFLKNFNEEFKSTNSLEEGYQQIFRSVEVQAYNDAISLLSNIKSSINGLANRVQQIFKKPKKKSFPSFFKGLRNKEEYIIANWLLDQQLIDSYNNETLHELIKQAQFNYYQRQIYWPDLKVFHEIEQFKQLSNSQSNYSDNLYNITSSQCDSTNSKTQKHNRQSKKQEQFKKLKTLCEKNSSWHNDHHQSVENQQRQTKADNLKNYSYKQPISKYEEKVVAQNNSQFINSVLSSQINVNANSYYYSIGTFIDINNEFILYQTGVDHQLKKIALQRILRIDKNLNQSSIIIQTMERFAITITFQNMEQKSKMIRILDEVSVKKQSSKKFPMTP